MLALPYRGQGPPVSLLLLVSSVGGNIPTRHLLDDRVFQTFVVVPEFYDPKVPLPPHQVVFNAIGDADLAAPALAAAQSVVALTSAPVINRPSAVLATGRADHARLAHLPGVVTPATVTLPRELLSSPEAAAAVARHGFHFPLLVRTPGFHTGRHFLRVESAEALAGAVAELPGRELTVIEFLDARGADGKVRKYRVMMIDGQLYPLHVAISSHWKIHYFTAEMAEQAGPSRRGRRVSGEYAGCARAARDGGAGADSSHARPGLCRHRFRLERRRRSLAVRSQRHDGGQSARARRTLGLPPSGGRADLRGRAKDADGAHHCRAVIATDLQ